MQVASFCYIIFALVEQCTIQSNTFQCQTVLKVHFEGNTTQPCSSLHNVIQILLSVWMVNKKVVLIGYLTKII